MSSESDIAVIGVGCRFPDAWSPEQFWRNIADGRLSMRPLTDEELVSAGAREELLRDPTFVRMAARLPGAEEFAGEFFGYPPAEAESIDPQQRIFLEVCWEALESAGHVPDPNGPVAGVFAGTSAGTYATMLLAARAATGGWHAALDDMDLHLGGLTEYLASRVGYKFGLRGPTVVVQTACSSALYATHYAVLSLLSGECDVALAGGSTVLEPTLGYRYQQGGTMSVDGYCRAFDARSTGTIFASGVGAVVLRRLPDALADGDHILAVVRGSAVGNDGGDRAAFSAPNPAGIAGVVRGALEVAEVDAEQLRYVEAHGTGTPLGDQIELRGLIQGLGRGNGWTGYCGLGSVKVNIGHTGTAAGIASLIKAVHVVGTGSLPPHPLFDLPRDPGRLAESPFFIATRRDECTDPDRHVLVNSMGLGGTTAAVVLGPPPAPTRAPSPTPERARLLLSARSRRELDAMSRALADRLAAGEAAVGDVAHTLRVGRKAFTERRVVTAAPDALVSALRVPRGPAVHTARVDPGRAVCLVVTADAEVPQWIAERFAVAFARRADAVRGPVEAAPPDHFKIVLGPGAPAPDRHVLPLDPTPDRERVDEAVIAAWSHGADVDWPALADGRGRRVPLPTYPFRRRRYWALDRLAEPAPARQEATAADEVEADLVSLWRRLFGIETIGVDDEFGALGGTSLLSVRMATELQQRHGVAINLHRVGGSRTTIRDIADVVRRLRPGHAQGPQANSDSDAALIDQDLEISLGPVADGRSGGRGVLLTGATGFVGSFLLHELARATPEPIYCLVRASDDDAAFERLRAAAARYELPEPERARVHPVVLGDRHDLGDACERHAGGELAGKVGLVVHCAARVVFTEPYRVARADNVLPLVALLRWMRRHGIRDFGAVSSIAATDYAMGAGRRVLETREQPLDTKGGGYTATKWVGERLLERAEKDGMRVRIFRPGFILGSTETGACNDKDLIWRILGSGVAVGAHPTDDRVLPLAPVDVVARAIVELSLSPGSAGRAYHLIDAVCPRQRTLFDLLAEAGWRTSPMAVDQWRDRVSTQAVAGGNEVLAAAAALYDQESNDVGEHDVQAEAWRDWLASRGLSVAPTGELLGRCLTFLARHHPAFDELLGETARVGTAEPSRVHSGD
jgi:phthiocerol/phenolphthiocerol synthesis type-I polyketide synthase E